MVLGLFSSFGVPNGDIRERPKGDIRERHLGQQLALRLELTLKMPPTTRTVNAEL